MYKYISSALFALSLPLQVHALELQTQPNTFDYNFLEAGFVDFDAGGSGLYLDASYDVHPNFNLLGGFSAADNYNEFGIGFGFHMALPDLENSDVNIFAGFEQGEFDVGGGTTDNSEDGAYLGVGIRASASRSFELHSALTYHSFYSGDLALTLGARLQINEKLDLSISGQLSDNDVLAVGIRYYY